MKVMHLVVSAILQAYGKFFLRAIPLDSRLQEYRADQLACLVAGRQPLIDWLARDSWCRHGVAVYWQREAAPALGGSALPAVSDGFARFVAAPHITDALNKGLEKTLLEAKTNPCDTHPPLRDRIAVAEKLPGLSVQEETELATTLLERLQELELRFVENRISSIKPGSLKYVSWDDVALTATIPAWQKLLRNMPRS